MKKIGKVVLHIPAREGSKRVPKKNLRKMNGSPMISYVIKESLESKITKEIYVNTDSSEIISYVEKNFSTCKIYKRPAKLATDNSSSEDFNLDIINSLNVDTLIMINPVCPLIKSSDIIDAFKKYKESDCDTLISCSSTKMQTFCEDSPVNFNLNEQLAPSQKNQTVKTLNWAITIWDCKSFIKRIKSLGYAVLGDNRLLYELDFIKSIKVSYEEDFILAEKILKYK
jgi:CMP-N-acetylneuraminic acid synthetase|tara:strand:- start:515 stop:1195 length:681 start_codon:yes stop_codon:yes gene_type:complete